MRISHMRIMDERRKVTTVWHGLGMCEGIDFCFATMYVFPDCLRFGGGGREGESNDAAWVPCVSWHDGQQVYGKSCSTRGPLS